MNSAHFCKKLTIILSIISFGILTSGCTSTAISLAGVKAWEDRSTEDQVTDTKIHTGILRRLQAKETSLIVDISTDVWEQRVMLTGTVDHAQTRSDAVFLARADKRIKKLYDHIRVVSTEEQDQRRALTKKDEAQDKQDTGQWVNDVWIETKIKGQLLVASGVTSVNFFWRSVLNDVYVIGRAKSRRERDAVLRVIRTTDGVRNVTHHIIVRPKV